MPRAQTDYRQRLINALAVVVTRDGYTGTKIQDVVKEARVSLRSFYAEFPNKEACFLALYDQQNAMVADIVEQDLDFSQPWREVMRTSFERYFIAMTAFPRLTHAYTIELATLSDDARTHRQNNLDLFVDRMIELVEQGRRANPDIASQPLTPMMARTIIGGVIELLFDRVVRGGTQPLDELIDTSTEMLWRAVTYPGDVRR